MPTAAKPRETPSQAARRRTAAIAILLDCPSWTVQFDQLGAPALLIAGSRGKTYRVSTRACTCPDANVIKSAREEGPCKHVLAVRMFSEIGGTYQQLARQLPPLQGGPPRGQV